MALSYFDKAALSQEDGMADWEFYGRKEQLAALKQMLDRKRWFFAKVTGRRRIGKTTLIQHAMEEPATSSRCSTSRSQIPSRPAFCRR